MTEDQNNPQNLENPNPNDANQETQIVPQASSLNFDNNFQTFDEKVASEDVSSANSGKEEASDNFLHLKNLIISKFSDVSSGSSSKGVAAIVLLLIFGGGLYMIFSSPDAVKEREKANKEAQLEQKKTELLQAAKAPSVNADDTLAATGGGAAQLQTKSEAPPSLPQIAPPQAPAPPPPPAPTAPAAPVFSSQPSVPAASPPPQIGQASQATTIVDAISGESEKRKQEMLARRKASIMVTGAGGGAGGGKSADGAAGAADGKSAAKSTANDADSKSSQFLGFDNGATVVSTQRTSAALSVKATNVGALDRMILQGKIMTAVLESAINSDLPGSVRAIVSRDVYAEQTDNILVPKGSRLVGTYATDVQAGQNRLAIKWDRLIRPDGVDVAIASDGTDELGRTGAAGFLDDKFWLKIGSAVLTSYVIPVAAKRLLNVKDSAVTSTTVTGSSTTGATSSTTTSGTTASDQLQSTVQKLQEGVTKAIDESLSTKPTITIDQGTMINVYVNKDIIFTPDQVYGGMKILQ